MARKKQPPLPKFVVTIIEKFEDFLDWIAPVVDWVGDKAEQIKAASDALPPPSQKWVKNRRIDTRNATVTIFLFFLAVMTALAMYLPNRPTYSDLEQRELTKFPKPTVMEVLDGTFFNNVNTWFADTFPYREQFLSAHSTLESFYGFRGKSIEGEVVIGDEIPDGTEEQTTQKPKPEAKPQPEPEPEQSTAPAASSEQETTPQPEQKPEEQQPEEKPEQKPESNKPKPPKTNNGQSDEFSDAETLGALYLNKNTAYEYYNFVRETADNYISMVNQAAKNLKGKAKVYDIVIPTSMQICVPEKTRKKLNTSDQAAAIEYLYKEMSDDVTTVNLMDTMMAHQQEKEYLYFRTDHHWTALGAYYAYEQFAPAAGRKAAPLSSFEEHIFEGFLGSFYRQLNQNKAMANKPDTVYAYAPKSASKITITTTEGKEQKYDIIRNADEMSDNLKYLTFIAGDNPWSVMENPKFSDGSSILLVKESFGNCFAPYLVESYQYVYVVDYRYINDIDSRKLAELVDAYHIQDVLFLNNISATREDSLVNQMTRFVG